MDALANPDNPDRRGAEYPVAGVQLAACYPASSADSWRAFAGISSRRALDHHRAERDAAFGVDANAQEHAPANTDRHPDVHPYPAMFRGSFWHLQSDDRDPDQDTTTTGDRIPDGWTVRRAGRKWRITDVLQRQPCHKCTDDSDYLDTNADSDEGC